MKSTAAEAHVANGWVARHWNVVRRGAAALTVVCLAATVALHPALAARYLSDDGDLAPSSRLALYVAEAVLTGIAIMTLYVGRRWRVPTWRRERIVLSVLSVVASLLLSALAAEGGLALVHRFVKPLGAERHYFFQHDPVLGWEHRPWSVATFKNSLVSIDGNGLRVSDSERGPSWSQALLLGDSQAFGDGVAAEETFAARLEALVPGFHVLNAAVIGYGTDQQLLYFEEQLRRSVPEVTVVALNAYDLRDNVSTRVRSGYEKPRFVLTAGGLQLANVPVPGDGVASRLNRALQYHSHLCRLLIRMWQGTRRQRDPDVPPAQRLALDVYPDEAQMVQGLSVTTAILAQLARRAREAGSQLIVLFLPYQMDFADAPLYGMHTERLVDALQREAETSDFTFLDGRRALTSDRPEKLFLDAMHLSPEGHQRVAALLAGALADNPISRTYAH